MKYLKLMIILLSASSAFAQSDAGYPKEADYIKATQTVFNDSFIEVDVIK